MNDQRIYLFLCARDLIIVNILLVPQKNSNFCKVFFFKWFAVNPHCKKKRQFLKKFWCKVINKNNVLQLYKQPAQKHLIVLQVKDHIIHKSRDFFFSR